MREVITSVGVVFFIIFILLSGKPAHKSIDADNHPSVIAKYTRAFNSF